MNDINFDESHADLGLIDSNKKEKVDKIIEKWFILQKTIKEELTLEQAISKQQKIDFEQLKKYFKEYYKSKLEIRRILEEIKNIENNDENPIKQINMERELEQIFLDISEPIKNLLFLFRNNYDYIITLISLITEYDEDDKISSLVELFCNQFYENILIKNSETEELIILIYKLLEKEVTPMNFSSIDEFLSDDTFLGKFISSFLKRYELKHFLSSLINPFILNIDNSKGDDYCGMSLVKINEFINEKISNGSLKKERVPKDFNIEKALFENITKSSINFNKENNDEKEEDIDSEEEIEQNIFENWIEHIKNDSNNKNFNNDYKIMLDLDFLNDKINKENNQELKNFYSYELEQITYDPNIFSNKTLIELFKENEFNENLKNILTIYKDNFKFLKNAIDYFIQLLIDQVEIIPYTLRCICKVISILLEQKFPLLSKYVRNSFIGKFIFDKCIFPVLCLENKNSLEPRIISNNTKKCLIDIISILDHANKCRFFNSELDSEKTIFNHYLIEIIPTLNKFYEKLIDVNLPEVFDNLLLSTKKNIEEHKRDINFNYKKLTKKQENNDLTNNSLNKGTKPIYNYFNEYKEEIINLQCICFSLDDILFILSLIGRNLRAFKDLPDYIFFERTYEFIQPSDYKLDQENSKNPDSKNFFIIFRDEKNSDLKNYLKERKNKILAFSPEEDDSQSIIKKFKFCVKKVLTELNFLNRKDYAYLNMAINSRQFFTALKLILEGTGVYSEIKNRIPLEWYSQYMFNNRDNLEDRYKFDDYLELYNEIFKEESEILEKLKSLISIIITRNRINLGNAENILETTKNELNHIRQMKEYVKVEKFINEEEIEVCIQTNELKNMRSNEKKRSFTMTMFFKKEKEVDTHEVKQPKMPLLITDDFNCPHNSHKLNEISENDNIEKKIPYHAYNIKDFISKFSEVPWKEEVNVKYKKPKDLVLNDIYNGSKTNQIYKSLNMYMDIVKKHLIEPTNGKQIFFKEWQDENRYQIIEKIKDYIIRQIYKFIYPEEPMGEDFNFFNKVKRLQWIKPEHLNIKNINILHLSNAISWIKKFEFYKAIKDKLLCINKIYIDMNNAIKFDHGINNEAKHDELKPLFLYIIIKAQPQRMLSNINYIKCFTDYIEIDEKISYLLTLLESSKEFVLNISYQFLNIKKEEFDENMKKIFK